MIVEFDVRSQEPLLLPFCDPVHGVQTYANGEDELKISSVYYVVTFRS